jgi:hypothetical protein
MASASQWYIFTGALKFPSLVSIKFSLPGRGLYFSGMLSHVFLHMSTAFFFLEESVVVVISLKNCIS